MLLKHLLSHVIIMLKLFHSFRAPKDQPASPLQKMELDEEETSDLVDLTEEQLAALFPKTREMVSTIFAPP